MEHQLSLNLNYQPLDKWSDGYYPLSELDLDLDNIKAIGLDIETNGLNPYDRNTEIKSISISGIKTSFGVDKAGFKLSLDLVRQIVESENVMIIGHNIKFDLNFLRVKFGWKINCLAYDTMLAAYFLNENDKFISLETLSDRYEIMPGYKAKVNRARMDLMNKKDMLLYNMKDARTCAILKSSIFDPLLNKAGQVEIMNIACQAIPVLSKMETRGVKVDLVYAKQQQMKMFQKLIDLKLSLKTIASTTFSPDSPQQLRNVLFSKFRFDPVNYTESGAASTDYESVLRIKQEQCGDRSERDVQFITTLLEYTKLGTLNEKYYNKLPTWIQSDGCVHTNYNLGATNTGRLTSSSPNMQNQKRGSDFRGVYVPREGYTFIEGDWSQIELRIAAELSNETKMIEIFEKGYDIHTATLCQMKDYDYDETKEIENNPNHPSYQELKNLRVGIKNINFGEMYGASPARLQREMVKNGIYWDMDECVSLYNQRKELYPNIVKWKKKIEQFILQNKYVVMPFGQVRRLPYADKKTPEGRTAILQGINFMIQSTASGWIPIMGMILLDNYFKEHKEYDGHILLQVHDSILSEVKQLRAAKMQQLMKDIKVIMEQDIKEFIFALFKLSLRVPLEFKCDYMDRWR